MLYDNVNTWIPGSVQSLLCVEFLISGCEKVLQYFDVYIMHLFILPYHETHLKSIV